MTTNRVICTCAHSSTVLHKIPYKSWTSAHWASVGFSILSAQEMCRIFLLLLLLAFFIEVVSYVIFCSSWASAKMFPIVSILLIAIILSFIIVKSVHRLYVIDRMVASLPTPSGRLPIIGHLKLFFNQNFIDYYEAALRLSFTFDRTFKCWVGLNLDLCICVSIEISNNHAVIDCCLTFINRIVPISTVLWRFRPRTFFCSVFIICILWQV